ncbi:hypothetical protein [Legionella fallonii]|uniref:hypothetical protein n=1 Tax=Legionella fallonii TaxID=96230 RepID=UPI0012ECE50D|nr:hypothetical protein [Legionella fallonii]
MVEKKCGKYIFQVQITNENDIGERLYKLYYQIADQEKKLFYQTELGMSLAAACIQNNKKQYLMLFQENCGGNGCPEDIFGIYDPNEKRMLVKPADWPKGNTKEIEKMIGHQLESSDNEKSFFCCGRQLYDFRFGHFKRSNSEKDGAVKSN